MKKNCLMLISTATLLACASNPPLPPFPPYDPGPAYREAPPAPAVLDEEAPPASEVPDSVADRSGQTDGGQWRVALISVRTVEKAAQLSRRVSSKGYRVETEVVEIGGASWQRLVLPGYRTEAEARAILPVVRQEFGFQSAWVPPRRETEP